MMVSNIFRPLYVTLTFSHKNQQITTHLVLVSVMGCYRKKQTGGEVLRAHVFEKDPWKFQISHFTLVNSRQNEASTAEIPQNCVTPIGISKTKSQDLWNFYTTFSGSLLEIPLLFLFTPGIFAFYLWKFHVLKPLVWIFSGIAQF